MKARIKDIRVIIPLRHDLAKKLQNRALEYDMTIDEYANRLLEKYYRSWMNGWMAESSIVYGDGGNVEFLSYYLCSTCSRKIFVGDNRKIIDGVVLCMSCLCSDWLTQDPLLNA